MHLKVVQPIKHSLSQFNNLATLISTNCSFHFFEDAVLCHTLNGRLLDSIAISQMPEAYQKRESLLWAFPFITDRSLIFLLTIAGEDIFGSIQQNSNKAQFDVLKIFSRMSFLYCFYFFHKGRKSSFALRTSPLSKHIKAVVKLIISLSVC